MRLHSLLRGWTVAWPRGAAATLALSAAGLLQAQQPTERGRFVVQGVVFDSVAGKPLAGAVVQVAARTSASAPWTATSDASGRYRIIDLPAGAYIVGFYHDALTALGLDGPSRVIELAADTLVTVDLAIPSSGTVLSLRCGDSSPFAPGMLVGFVRDADSRGAVPDAKATLEWKALALEADNYRTVTERATATIGEDGAFVACHLPVDAPLELLVTAPGHVAVGGPVVTVPANGIARLDVLLVDSASTHGAAMIRGSVRRLSGKAVASGRVAVKALERDVPVKDGEFVVADLPPGSWVAEARVIGVEPQAIVVTAEDSVVTSASFTVSDHAQRLDAVTVLGKPDRNTLLLNDVLRRSRIGNGTTFLPGSPALRSAIYISDVMREARGFRYAEPTKILGRAGCTTVDVYVNDVKQPDGFDGLDAVAKPADVLAIEAYPDILVAPVQYRRIGIKPFPRRGFPPPSPPCAVVLIWTRQ